MSIIINNVPINVTAYGILVEYLKDRYRRLFQDTTRRIHVSADQGDTWSMAQLPSVGQEQFYSILAANDDMVFMHVDEPGGESFANGSPLTA